MDAEENLFSVEARFRRQRHDTFFGKSFILDHLSPNDNKLIDVIYYIYIPSCHTLYETLFLATREILQHLSHIPYIDGAVGSS